NGKRRKKTQSAHVTRRTTFVKYQTLYIFQEIKNGIMHANLKGIGLGDSYTSPIDYVVNYAPFALTIGLIDKQGYKIIDDLAQRTQKAIDEGLYHEAFDLEVKITNALVELTRGIDVYNIVIKSNSTSSPKLMSYEKKCNKFMNSIVKERLNIPEEITWTYTNKDIYNALDGDIMRSVTDRIEYLLNDTDIKIIVYNGIFDFIVNTSGTLSWLDRLDWFGAPLWHDTPQEAL
ncbi:Peptidase, partial [Oryctes borbonicus]